MNAVADRAFEMLGAGMIPAADYIKHLHDDRDRLLNVIADLRRGNAELQGQVAKAHLMIQCMEAQRGRP